MVSEYTNKRDFMLKNKKGAALLQVLLITVVLGGMAAMLLRASLSRTSSARQTRRSVSAQLYINSCMAEVNTFWTLKSPEAFARDMSQCIMYCGTGTVGEAQFEATGKKIEVCPANKQQRSYECQNGIVATFTETAPTDGRCKLEYQIPDTANYDHL
jgi:hypothetical protein